MDQIYDDKLEGKIAEEFWSRKQAHLREQELALEGKLAVLARPVIKENVLSVKRIFELAKEHVLFTLRGMPPNEVNFSNPCF